MAKKVEIKTIISAVDNTKSPIQSATQSLRNLSQKAQFSGKGVHSSFGKINNALRPLQNNIRKTSVGMSAFKGAIMGMGLLGLASKVKNSVLNFAAMNDELSKNSRAVGMSVESMQGLNYAADRQGVSTQALYTHLKKFHAGMGDLRKGQGKLVSGLKKTNPELLEQLKATKNNEEAFLLVSEAVHKVEDSSEKASLTASIFSQHGLEMQKMFEGGAGEITKLMKEQEAFGIVSTEQAKKCEDLQDEFTKLKASGAGVGKSMMLALLTPLLMVTQSIRNLLVKNQGLINGLAKLIGKLIPLVPVILGVVAAFKIFRFVTVTLPLIFTAITTIMPFLIGLFNGTTISVWAMNAAFLANPVVLIVVGIIAAIAAAIAIVVILYKKFESVRNIIQAIGRGLRDFFSPILNAVKVAFSAIYNTVKNLFSFIPGRKKVVEELEPPETESTPLKAQEQTEMLEKMHYENKSQTQIDINFNNLPKGVMVSQTAPVAGITLNLGYSGS